MPKNESCTLTKGEWNYLHKVFDEHYHYADEPEKAYKKLHTLHMKLFFMNELVKQQEEAENA